MSGTAAFIHRSLSCLLTTTTIVTVLLLALLPSHGHAYSLEPQSTAKDLIVYSQDILNWQPWGPDFLGGLLSRRAPPGVEALKNNAPNKKNLRIGETQHFVVHKSVLSSPKSPPPKGFPKSDYDDGISIRSLAKRAKVEASGKQNVQQKSKTALYITATTCLQPRLNNSHAADDDAGPDQLVLYYSTTTPRPGPTTKDTEKAYFKEGYVNVTLYPDDDVYIGVGAANKSTSSSGSEGSEWTGIYNFEIAVSIDSNFHDVETDDSFLHFVDSDNSTALLWTDDTTNAYPTDKVYKEWMAIDPPPFTLFAQDVKYASSIAGLRNSYCGLHNNVVINGDAYFKTKMTDKGLQQYPKEQFAVRGLNGSSTYLGFLAMKGNSTNSGDGVVGGGGKIWKAMNFTTKAENNSALLYDLNFCDQVAYAVPANKEKHNITQIKSLYDKNAEKLYSNFTKSLSIIPCDAEPKGQYSLVSNCTSCAAAYKKWLCAVTIPRAKDFSDDRSFLRARNTGQAFPNGTKLSEEDTNSFPFWTNTTRNPVIAKDVQPGPYKEVPPCIDLCHEITQKCPTSLGFKCPTGKLLDASYGKRSPDGDITCSYLGAAYFSNGARRSVAPFVSSFGAAIAFWLAVCAL